MRSNPSESRNYAILTTSISTVVILSSATYTIDYGISASAIGAIMIVLYSFLHALRSRGGYFFSSYKWFNVCAIFFMGFVNGLWNHLIKMIITWIYGGAIPAGVTRIFFHPNIWSSLYETLGLLTFLASLVAVHRITIIMSNLRRK